MAGTSTQRGRRQKFTDITIPSAAGGPGGGDWSIPRKLTALGESGLVSRVVLRAPAGSSITGAEIKIFQGDAYSVATNAEDVPDEDAVYHETAITVAGHDTTADSDVNVLLDKAGAGYDTRLAPDDMWVSVKRTAGTAQADVVLSVEARETL